MIRVDHIDSLLQNLELNPARPRLIGIDGRPCSGKSTLADLIKTKLHADVLCLDDFFIPSSEWPNEISPAFPFPYFRYADFIQGLQRLSNGMIFEYQAYDWSIKQLGEIKSINPENIIIVEGVSVLSEQLAPCYNKTICVMSNESNELEAICQRENNNMKVWKELYLPSVEIYWQTKPWERADILYRGRGL